MKKTVKISPLAAPKRNKEGDDYISDKINMFFALYGNCDPATEGQIAAALELVIDKVYNDGFEDAHLPDDDNRCIVCGSYMPSE